MKQPLTLELFRKSLRMHEGNEYQLRSGGGLFLVRIYHLGHLKRNAATVSIKIEEHEICFDVETAWELEAADRFTRRLAIIIQEYYP
jgi:hypothetical protein